MLDFMDRFLSNTSAAISRPTVLQSPASFGARDYMVELPLSSSLRQWAFSGELHLTG
jgi:hypothetical protein